MPLLLSGCYLSHGRGDAPEHDAMPDGGRDAGPDGGLDGGIDGGPADAGPPALRFCEAECTACLDRLGVTFVTCMGGCVARFEVAAGEGCAADFQPWIDCIVEQSCDVDVCLPLRSCW